MTDTICAIATARGAAALGIIRISGPLAADILLALVPGTRAVGRPRRVCYGRILDDADGTLVDEVLCSFFRAPASATGEDVAEVCAHGGTLVLARILELAVAHGARLAHPGEFSSRAFANGKMDLTQAEAVMALIGARSQEAAKVAARQLGGAIAEGLEQEYAALTAVCARLEAGLDYPDEDLLEEDLAPLNIQLEKIIGTLRQVGSSYAAGRRLVEGARIAIVGPSNAGKSSLLNSLLGEVRALVDHVPGTTRDVVSAERIIGGVPVTFLDTAGIRDGAKRVERQGIEMSRKVAGEADLVLVVVDGAMSDPLPDGINGWFDDDGNVEVLGVLNKQDLPAFTDRPIDFGVQVVAQVAVSAKTGAGLDRLVELIGRRLGGAQHEEGVVITTLRQRGAIDGALVHLAAAKEHLERGINLELAAVELRFALESLASLWGRHAPTDVIEEIFSSFCLGK